MGQIPMEYRPPEEYLPETVQLLPELNYPQNLNLAEVFLDRNVAEHPDKVAIYFEREPITYRELWECVIAVRDVFHELV